MEKSNYSRHLIKYEIRFLAHDVIHLTKFEVAWAELYKDSETTSHTIWREHQIGTVYVARYSKTRRHIPRNYMHIKLSPVLCGRIMQNEACVQQVERSSVAAVHLMNAISYSISVL